jgi:parallel beta-helix repeat protein
MSKMQWYAKSSYVLLALALVLSLWVVAVPLRGTVEAVFPGPHYYVATTGSDANNGTSWAWAWKTITYAVETGATTFGDVIHVADGLYDTTNNGEAFPIDFNTNGVSLIGAGGDTSIIDANNQEKNILNIWVDGVNISDFELINAKATSWRTTGNGIYMNDAEDCHISNLKIYNLTEGGSATREPAGIFVDDDSDGNTFSSIEIYDISSCAVARGIYMWRDSDGNTFTDINIHDVSVSNSCLSEFAVFGIHVDGSSGICDHNQFDSIVIHDISGGDWGEGIELQQSNGNTLGDLSISDVYGEYHAYGIKLGDSSDNTLGSSSEIWNIVAPSGTGIGIGVEKDPTTGSNRNTFESFDIHDTYYGFYISKSDDNSITKSNIHDNVEGVHICSGNLESEGNKVNCNNIYRNRDYGVYKAYSPPVDATGNWWGDAYGPSHSPGNGDEVSDNVDYDPYLSFVFQYCPQCGGSLPPPPSAVPTVNHWGIFAMITLFAGLLVWRVRRKRLAS